MYGSNVFAFAQRYVSIGELSVLPVLRDGSKGPAAREWKQWQERKPSIDEIIQIWDSNRNVAPPGIGIIGGAVSGGLCIIDLESSEIFESWKFKIAAEELARCVIVKSPCGYHVSGAEQFNEYVEPTRVCATVFRCLSHCWPSNRAAKESHPM